LNLKQSLMKLKEALGVFTDLITLFGGLFIIGYIYWLVGIKPWGHSPYVHMFQFGGYGFGLLLFWTSLQRLSYRITI
jgi:hypothetical protein